MNHKDFSFSDLFILILLVVIIAAIAIPSILDSRQKMLEKEKAIHAVQSNSDK